MPYHWPRALGVDDACTENGSAFLPACCLHNPDTHARQHRPSNGPGLSEVELRSRLDSRMGERPGAERPVPTRPSILHRTNSLAVHYPECIGLVCVWRHRIGEARRSAPMGFRCLRFRPRLGLRGNFRAECRHAAEHNRCSVEADDANSAGGAIQPRRALGPGRCRRTHSGPRLANPNSSRPIPLRILRLGGSPVRSTTPPAVCAPAGP